MLLASPPSVYLPHPPFVDLADLFVGNVELRSSLCMRGDLRFLCESAGAVNGISSYLSDFYVKFLCVLRCVEANLDRL